MDAPGQGRGGPQHKRPYFFLSYAHTPPWGPDSGDPDHWVRVLYRDLCTHIMAITDLPAGFPVGFMDREMRSGEGWPEKLAENLATCRVFVPLLSPRYFSSEMCGREWFAFNERMLRARATGAGGVSAVVPALWTRVDLSELPDSVRHVHLDQAAWGSRYATGGIYGLIKLKRLRDEYEEIVLSLAQRIVDVARESQLPPDRPRDYESTPSAFKPRGTGPRHIRLTVAAPTRDALPEYRDPRPYGDDPRDWNPYHSESTRPLSALAEDLIRSLDYRVTVASFDDEAPDDRPAPPPDADGTGDTGASGTADTHPDADADGRTAAGHPGILLVDQWALTDEERRRRLKAFDAGARPWVSAIVPRNRADLQCHGEEGRRLAEELERALPLVLERGRRTDCRTAVTGVPTLKAFTDLLPAVVAHTTRQYLKHAEAHPPAGPHIPRPRLLGSPYPPPPPAGDHDGDGGEA